MQVDFDGTFADGQPVGDLFIAQATGHEANDFDLARRQGARSLELRAALSLGRWWQRRGRRDEAQSLLAGIYNWFTEGFGTADLQEAKALLDEWS